MLYPSRLFVYHLVARLLPETRAFRLKATLVRWCGASVGKGVRICSSAVFSGTGELSIGKDVWVGQDVRISSGSKVVIGACVDIGPQVLIGTGTHEIDLVGEHSAGRGVHKNVVVGSGAWLGARSTLLPGVVIGKKAVVAAGSVVTGDIPDRSLAAGVPARVKKCLG